MIIIYLIVFLCIISLLLMPYEKVLLGRIFTVLSIKRICREKEFDFKIINRSYMFFSNKNNEFDFIIKVKNTVIPVKFFSAKERDSTIILSQSGNICIRKKYTETFSRDGRKKVKNIDTKGKLPSMKIRRDIIGERYTCFPVLLNEPEYRTVLIREPSGNICNFFDKNSKIAGCHWLDKNTFEALLVSYTKENN